MPFIVYYIIQSVKLFMGWYEKWETYLIDTGESLQRFITYPDEFLDTDVSNSLRYIRFVSGNSDIFEEKIGIRRLVFDW